MAQKSKIAAIIVSAGKGTRTGSAIPKQYHKINNKEIITHTLEKFLNHKDVNYTLPVISEANENLFLDATKKLSIDHYTFGGETRQESVFNGLKFLNNEIKPDYVLIHDAARPFVSQNLIDKIISSLNDNSGIIPVIKVPDTLKNCNSDGLVNKTIDRENIFLSQTPQAFPFETIFKLHKKYKDENLSDDALLYEKESLKIKTIAGEKTNYKITTKEDLENLKMDKNETKQVKVGQGFDVHSFTEGNKVTICGTEIAHSKSLKGHSDADVGWHAVTDAMLGAIGLGDIGEHFPDDKKDWENADSSIFLKFANEKILESGGIINNIDITIICEKPKLSKYKVLEV